MWWIIFVKGGFGVKFILGDNEVFEVLLLLLVFVNEFVIILINFFIGKFLIIVVVIKFGLY